MDGSEQLEKLVILGMNVIVFHLIVLIISMHTVS